MSLTVYVWINLSLCISINLSNPIHIYLVDHLYLYLSAVDPVDGIILVSLQKCVLKTTFSLSSSPSQSSQASQTDSGAFSKLPCADPRPAYTSLSAARACRLNLRNRRSWSLRPSPRRVMPGHARPCPARLATTHTNISRWEKIGIVHPPKTFHARTHRAKHRAESPGT